MTDKLDKAYGLTDTQKKYKQWLSLLQEYRFFTPGLAYWRSPIDRDIVSDFIAQYSLPKPDRPRLYTADHDIFKLTDPIAKIYIGDKEFMFNVARMVYLCPLQTWPTLSAHLDGCGFVYDKDKSIYKLLHQYNIPMLDPGSSRYGMVGTPIEVDAWCMYSNLFCNVFRFNPANIAEPPFAIRATRSEVLVEDGKLFFEGKLEVEDGK